MTVLLEQFHGEILTLDAVDRFTDSVNDHWNSYAQVIKFRLNGKIYIATEDPSDGYRSYLGSLIEAGPDETMRNVFPPVKVRAEQGKGTHGYGVSETTAFIDVVTDKLVLEIGTYNTDDYYPSFADYFDPTAMSINQ